MQPQEAKSEIELTKALEESSDAVPLVSLPLLIECLGIAEATQLNPRCHLMGHVNKADALRALEIKRLRAASAANQVNQSQGEAGQSGN